MEMMQYMKRCITTTLLAGICFAAFAHSAVVIAQATGRAGGQLSSTCRFAQGPRAGQVQSYKGMVQPIPVGSQCTDGQQSFGTAIPD